jgi:hypothetical protein
MSIKDAHQGDVDAGLDDQSDVTIHPTLLILRLRVSGICGLATRWTDARSVLVGQMLRRGRARLSSHSSQLSRGQRANFLVHILYKIETSHIKSHRSLKWACSSVVERPLCMREV